MRTFLLVVSLGLFGLPPVMAQQKGRESAAKSAEAGLSFQALLDSAAAYKSSHIDRSIDFIALALEGLSERGSEKERAEALSRLGEIYQYHGQYDLAIANYRDAQSLNSTVSTALRLGRCLIEVGSYQEAQSVLQPLEDLGGMVPYQRIELFEGLGDVYRFTGDTRRAVSYFEEGLVVAGKNSITPKIPDLNSKIADTYAGENRSEEAEAYYRSSLEQAASQTPARAVRENEKVADFYNRENRFDEEIRLRKKSLSELKGSEQASVTGIGLSRAKDTITSQQINYKIANAYVEQDRLDDAIPYLVESIKKADSNNDLEIKKDATRRLSEVYSEKGDYTRALETYRQYVAVVDTLYQRKESEIAQAARFNRELASRQNRISSLERDKQLSQSKFDLAITRQQLAEETNRRQQWLIYSLLLVILLTALAAFFFYRSNRQQKIANELLALKSLRSQMNPHFIFNALNSVNSFIARKDERLANRYLSDFSALMRAVLENTEEDYITLDKEMELIGLYLKLEHARFPEKFDYRVEIGEKADPSRFFIPPMILQPFVENAVWHGLRYKEDKGFLRIKVSESDKGLQVVIEDNGIGRKASAKLKTRHQKKQKSTGMKNIKERIAILNKRAKHQIDVAVSDLHPDGTGTRVQVTVSNRK